MKPHAPALITNDDIFTTVLAVVHGFDICSIIIFCAKGSPAGSVSSIFRSYTMYSLYSTHIIDTSMSINKLKSIIIQSISDDIFNSTVK